MLADLQTDLALVWFGLGVACGFLYVWSERSLCRQRLPGTIHAKASCELCM